MMKPELKSFIFLLIVNVNFCYCQSFINGDLDGVINGISSLPNYWQNVPFGDPNCLASQVPNDTPDLTNISGPSAIDGVMGNPFSGNTFISGAMGHFFNTSDYTQEGIMQQVSGFVGGQSFRIRFRQAVVKIAYGLDKSGSWAIYIDTVLAGITAPTHSNEPYNSITLTWEARSISFTATAATHLIKFLPMDDDSNWFFSTTDTLGALYMGIDSISLNVITGINEVNSNTDFNLFPNPNNGSFKLQYKGIINKPLILSITDVCGKLTDKVEIKNQTTNYENTSLMNGLYFYSLRNGDEEVGRGKIMVVR